MAAHGLCKLQTSCRTSIPGFTPRTDPFHSVPVRSLRPRISQNPWPAMSGVALQSSSTRTHLSKHRPVAAAIVSSSPTTDQPVETSTPEEKPRWSCAAVKAISVSDVEVRRHRHSEKHPEILLMGILTDGKSLSEPKKAFPF